MKNTNKFTTKNAVAMTVAALVIVISMLLTGCVDDTATPDQAQATQATNATINKNETTSTENGSTEAISGTTVPTTAKDSKSEKATEAKTSNESSSKSDSSSSSSKSSGNSGGSSSNSGNGSSGGGSSTSKPSSGGGSSSSSSSSSSDPHAGKTYHEAVYENVWVVDQAAYSYEDPVYDTRVYTICHVCGAEFDTTYSSSSFWAHNEAHALAGEGSGYHNEVREVQTGSNTVYVPEEGHYEKKLVKEAGWY